MKVKIEKEEVIDALKKYIIEIAYRKKEKNRYTKFDSENDTFLGYIGELAFKKKLLKKGFKEETDFFHISEKNYDDKYIKKVNGKRYDEFDFLLDIFYDQEKNKNKEKSLKIDVKTQKYIGKFDENWQFAVNSKTIEKIKKDTSKITHFLFIFSNKGLSDITDAKIEELNIENLRYLYKNLEDFLKIKEFEIEICGLISTEKFLFLSEEFKTGDTFRVNIKQNGEIQKFNAKDNMYRIYLKYLENLDKVIPSKKINIKINSLEEYIKAFPNEKNYVKICNEDQEVFFPYNKVYLNSQYKNIEELIKKVSVKTKTQNGRKMQ